MIGNRGPGLGEPNPVGGVPDVGEELANVRQGVVAKIGDLEFIDAFSDPDVEITHDRDTTDHELVTGHTAYRDEGVEFVIQVMGRNAPEIDISGWITKEQLGTADALVKESRVRIDTNRWSGAAVPLRTDINYSRHQHDEHGQIFEVDIELLGTNRNGYPDTSDDTSSENNRVNVSDIVSEARRDRR